MAQGSDGQLGVTGEGTLLDNAESTNFKATKQTAASPMAGGQDSKEAKGITIAAAKYSSEDSATLVQYTIALVEYSQRCGPLRKAADRMHELEREIEETERIRHEEAANGETEKVKRLKLSYEYFCNGIIMLLSTQRTINNGKSNIKFEETSLVACTCSCYES